MTVRRLRREMSRDEFLDWQVYLFERKPEAERVAYKQAGEDAKRKAKEQESERMDPRNLKGMSRR